ncbi:acyloxyacyl hydrolase [Bordetella sp. FB-8]|uniref:acyloxyacyl hydrolase n=1 Tax=Bordetella sp. FB-8 TaxID=1159870 RepID=UPI00037F7AEC|nr:acyloxyacyl hydrolase [Bordetella sp. FB-8]
MLSDIKFRVLAGLAGLALTGIASTVQAQTQAQTDSAGVRGGIGIHYGLGNRYSRLGLQYETSPIWTYSFGGSLGRVDLTPEIGVAYWQAHGRQQPSSVWQLSAIPMFRWWLGASQRFYVEAGIGPTVFSHTAFADKHYSTAFQFGDHIGMGYLLDRHSRVGMRFSHFSNADIKTPNPGMDVIQATYTYQF